MTSHRESEPGGNAPQRRRGVHRRAAAALRERPRARRALAFGLAALTLGATALWYYLSTHESTDDAFVDGPIVAIAPRVGGTISAVHVVENQAVRAGDLLVEILPRDYQLAVAKAEADLDAAEAAAAAARARVPVAESASSSGTTSAEARVAQAEAALAAADQATLVAQARLEQTQAAELTATQDAARLKTLVERDEVAREIYDHATAGEAAAHAAVREAEQGVALAGSRRSEARAGLDAARAARAEAASGPHKVEVSDAERRLAEARVAQARAALDLAKSQLADTELRAPTDGLIGKKNAEVGESVQVGQPLLALVPIDALWVTANFKETQISAMKAGQPVTIAIDAFHQTFRGSVESIGAATGSRFSLLPAQNATGNYVKVVQRVPVRIAFEPGQDPQHRLRPGLSVVPTVKLE